MTEPICATFLHLYDGKDAIIIIRDTEEGAEVTLSRDSRYSEPRNVLFLSFIKSEVCYFQRSNSFVLVYSDFLLCVI